MPKNKTLLIISIIFFLLINTTYYWEGMLGTWAMLGAVILFLTFIILAIALIYQLFLAIKEKLNNKFRIISITIMTAILVTTAIKPGGLIDFDKFEGADLLIAGRKGVAGCSIILKLKSGNQFYEREICFGVDKVSGTYSMNKDTVMFKYSALRNKAFQFGVIKSNKHPTGKAIGEIALYRSINDTDPLILAITQNDLIK